MSQIADLINERVQANLNVVFRHLIEARKWMDDRNPQELDLLNQAQENVEMVLTNLGYEKTKYDFWVERD